jgi:zinc protease
MRAARVAALALLLPAAACSRRSAPEPGTPEARADSLLDRKGPPVGLRAVQRLRYRPLRFDPPTPEEFTLSNGVTVFFLEDKALPLVDVFINVRGGYVHFDRDHYAAAAALLPLMRNGGTRELTPDSLDALVEFHALGLRTSTDGGRMVLGINGLSRQLDLALDLWGDLLLEPRFDPAAVEQWRERELDAVRRIGNFPGSLAVLQFNRIMYGDHPTGWMMTEEDLAPERLSRDRLLAMHRQSVCPETAVIGASGDVSRRALEAALERALAGWEPCGEELREPPQPRLHSVPAIYVIPKDIPQSTVVVGQPGGVLLRESADYFASRIANWIIGGSGFTSRLVSRLRTEEGLAYSAASIWGAARDHERIFGAITHTKSESTLEAMRLMLETLEEARSDPPDREEVELAREAIVNGFVFGFNSPAQVVSRQVSYLAEGFPRDWLSRYLEGIRDVEMDDIADLLARRIRPGGFTVLIVGDTTAFDVSELGPYTILPGS